MPLVPLFFPNHAVHRSCVLRLCRCDMQCRGICGALTLQQWTMDSNTGELKLASWVSGG